MVNDLQTQLHGLQAQNAAKQAAIDTRLGAYEDGIEPIPNVGWGLLFAEYWRRKKMYQFVGPDALRPKGDVNQNQWTIKSIPSTVGATPEFQAHLYHMADQLGYDPVNPPNDRFMLLHCFPLKGSYDVACVELERANARYLQAQRDKARAEKALSNAQSQNRPTVNAMAEVDNARADIDSALRFISECKAVIENAIERFYLVSMDAFEEMDLYGRPIRCMIATVQPQKNLMTAPEYRPPTDRPPVRL